MTQIILVRHGESLGNRQHRLQGNSDSPLTEIGVRQAQLLAQRLAELQFTTLYSSDAGRASETARIVSDLTGHEVIFDSRLRERHFGQFEGLTGAEIENLYPDDYACFKSRDPAYCMPGGESALAFHQRVLTCMNEIAARHEEQTIVAITHGLVLDIMYRSAYRIALSDRRTFELVNAGINRLHFRTGIWQVQIWGDDKHLDAGLRTAPD